MKQARYVELEVDYCYKRILNHWAQEHSRSINDQTLDQTHSNIHSKLKDHAECFNLALILEQNEQYDTALKLYFDAWRYNPSSIEYQEAFEKSIKFKLSMDIYNEECYYLYAVFLKNQRRYHSALTVYKILTVLSPLNDGYMYSFGGLYYELNDNVEYQNLILKAMKLSPLNAIYYHDYAYYLRLRANSFKLSQKYFLIAIKLSSESNELYIRNLICLLKALKQYKMAQVYMKKILSLSSSNNELSIQLLNARLMIDIRDLNKAKRIYESLIQKYKNNWKIHSCFGTFLILILDFKKAEIHYRESLTNCYNPRNLFNYICLMHSMNRFKECIKYLLKLSIKCNLKIHKEGDMKIENEECIFLFRGAQNLGEIPSKQQIEKLSAESYELFARILMYFNRYKLSEKYFKMSLKLDQQNEVSFSGFILLKMELNQYESVKYLYDKALFYINRYLPNPRPFLLQMVYVYTLCHKLKYYSLNININTKDDDINILDVLFKEIEEKNKQNIVPEPIDIDIKEIGIDIDSDELYDDDNDGLFEEEEKTQFQFIKGIRSNNYLNDEEIDCLCDIMNKWLCNNDKYNQLLSVDKHYLHIYCGLSLLFGNQYIVMNPNMNYDENRYLVLNECRNQFEKALFYRPFCVESLCCLYLLVTYLKQMNKLSICSDDNNCYQYQTECDLISKGKQIDADLFIIYLQKFTPLL